MIQERFLQALKTLERIVGITYGPFGRQVALDRPAGILSTRDGNSVLWEVLPEHPIERIAVQIVQQSVHQVSTECGDGTSTTTLLICSLFQEAHKRIVAGEDPVAIANTLRSYIGSEVFSPTPPDHNMLRSVALSATNRDEAMTEAILESLELAGDYGMVVIEDGVGLGYEVKPKPGIQIPWGWESQEFSAGGSRCIELPLVALFQGSLSKLDEVVSVLEESTAYESPLVIVTSQGVYHHALQTLVKNDRKLKEGKFEVVATRTESLDLLEDLAAISGATIVDQSLLGTTFDSKWFGGLQRVEIRRDKSTYYLAPPQFDQALSRAESLRGRETEFSFDREKLQTRIAMLTEGLCSLQVGGASELDRRDRKARLEDALSAVRSAVDHGVVPGGGVAFLSPPRMEPWVCKALQAPFRRLLENAGWEPSPILSRLPKGFGFDVLQGGERDFLCEPYQLDTYHAVHRSLDVALSTVAELVLVSKIVGRRAP